MAEKAKTEAAEEDELLVWARDQRNKILAGHNMNMQRLAQTQQQLQNIRQACAASKAELDAANKMLAKRDPEFKKKLDEELEEIRRDSLGMAADLPAPPSADKKPEEPAKKKAPTATEEAKADAMVDEIMAGMKEGPIE